MKKYKTIRQELPIRDSSLNLSNLGLKVIPLDKKYEKITKLSATHNQIQTLTNISQFASLKELNISNNNIQRWTDLRAILHPHKLKKLFVKSNPLENEPNFRFHILKHFINLEKIDELDIVGTMRKDLQRLEDSIGKGLMDWVSSMVALDKFTEEMISRRSSLEIESERMLTKVQILFKKHIPILAQKQLSSLDNFLLVNGYEIEQILIESSKILTTPSRSRDHVQPVEFAFFTELLAEITQHNSLFVSYLLSQVQLDSPEQERILVDDSETSLQIIFCEFKRLQFKDKSYKHTRMSSLQTDIVSNRQMIDVFPYLSTEKYFVQAISTIMLEIMQDNIVKVDHLLKKYTNLDKAGPKLSPKQSQSLMNQSSTVLSNNIKTERQNPHFPQTYPTTVRYNDSSKYDNVAIPQNNVFIEPESLNILEESKKQIPTALAVVLLNILEAYQVKSAFNRVKKHSNSISQSTHLAVLFAVKRALNLRIGFESIKEKYHEEINIEAYYGRLKLMAGCFRSWKGILLKKWSKNKMLKKLLNKKERIQQAAKHFAFARWKIMSSRTLRYINEVKKTAVTHMIGQSVPTAQRTQRQIEREYEKLRRGLKRTTSCRQTIAFRR